jgi:aryl-alcohol dehydrogenase-like predicted oxidoreductase
MENWRRKIGIGSANFGSNYGINNPNGKIATEEVKRIIMCARSFGIDTIDTAAGYGDSEPVLGDCGVKDFHVITKIDPRAQTPERINQSLQNSLSFLKIDQIYGVLVHNPKGFYESPANWTQLLRLRDTGFISKIGVSVYQPSELEVLLERGLAIELVQVPYSVLDTRFKALFPTLREAGIEIHVRSLFLQGIFFMNPGNLPTHLAPVLSRIKRLRELSGRLCVPLSTVLLAIGVLEPTIDRLIIGVDSVAHLQENLKAVDQCSACAPVLEELYELGLLDESILLPINWPKAP